MLGAVAFTAVVWGSVALVLAVFAYVAYAVATTPGAGESPGSTSGDRRRPPN